MNLTTRFIFKFQLLLKEDYDIFTRCPIICKFYFTIDKDNKMIVKTFVKNKDNVEVEQYFLVRFDHSPIPSPKPKNWRRKGKCTIYLLNEDGPENQFFASRICGEKYKEFLISESIWCNESDTYLKAFTRRYTLQKCLQKLISDWKFTLNNYGFRLDNDNFKDFMTTLSKDHPHGDKQAIEMLRNIDYLITKKKKNKEKQ